MESIKSIGNSRTKQFLSVKKNDKRTLMSPQKTKAPCKSMQEAWYTNEVKSYLVFYHFLGTCTLTIL